MKLTLIAVLLTLAGACCAGDNGGMNTSLLFSAYEHHQAGRLPEAAQLYREVIADDPGNADAWHLLGLIFTRYGKYPAAVDCIRRAIELQPRQAVLHFNLGPPLENQGRAHEAEASYRLAIAIQPDYAAAWNNLGGAIKAQGRYAAAAEAYRKAAELGFVGATKNLDHTLLLHRLFPAPPLSQESVTDVNGRLPPPTIFSPAL